VVSSGQSSIASVVPEPLLEFDDPVLALSSVPLDPDEDPEVVPLVDDVVSSGSFVVAAVVSDSSVVPGSVVGPEVVELGEPVVGVLAVVPPATTPSAPPHPPVMSNATTIGALFRSDIPTIVRRKRRVTGMTVRC
jgi:hypothetical protein